MPKKVSDLLAEKANADIQVGGSSLGFVFWAMWRERFTDEERQSHVGLQNREYLKVFLPRILVSWELVDDEGHAVPVTAEAIEQHEIPDSLLLAFHARVLKSDLSGKATSSNLSGT